MVETSAISCNKNDTLPEDAWRESGGVSDPSNPHLPIPSSVGVVDEGNGATFQEHEITEREIEWMTSQHALVFSAERMAQDYGEHITTQMAASVKGAGMPLGVAGAMAWPGAGTRWQRFVAWYSAQVDKPTTARDALAGFARSVGRVTTYRALALDDAAFKRIIDEDEIFPSGRCNTSSVGLRTCQEWRPPHACPALRGHSRLHVHMHTHQSVSQFYSIQIKES